MTEASKADSLLPSIFRSPGSADCASSDADMRATRSATAVREDSVLANGTVNTRQSKESASKIRRKLVGLVDTRRDGKTIYYSLNSDKARRIIEVIYDLFCPRDV